MQVRWIALPLIPLLVLGLVLSGCGGGGSSQPTSSSTAAPSTEGQPAEASPETETPSEAESAATGDIPDNQVFLTYTNHAAGYSIRYPEGWARRGAARGCSEKWRRSTVAGSTSRGSSHSNSTSTAPTSAPAVS